MIKNNTIFILLAITASIILIFSISNAQKISKSLVVQNTVSTNTKTILYTPVAEFKSRITKKFFGTYVTPINSPVTPEHFTGYHTGVDIEYGDVLKTVPVFAITNGKVIFSGVVKGYGGVIVTSGQIKGQNVLVLYGHLKPASLSKTGTNVSAGEQIGVLGKANSSETDGERKHLHFAIIKGNNIDFRGYVMDKNELQNWYNPIDFY